MNLSRGKNGGTWIGDRHVHSAVFKMESQQGPIV